MDEATVWNKERLLITYVRFIDADDLKEDLLFCKQITSRATADELFQTTDAYFERGQSQMGRLCGNLHRRGSGWETRRAATSASPPMPSGRTA